MDVNEAQSKRFDGTVAIWFTSHHQADARDWNNIQEFNGAYHPLLGYYKSDNPEVLRQQLHWMRRAGVDVIVYDVYGFAKWSPTDLPKDKALLVLIDELSNQNQESRKLQLVIWLEKYMYNPTAEEYRYALHYVQENLAHRDWYYRYDGAPLVVTYHNGQNDAIDEIEWENRSLTLRRVRPYYSDVWAYVDHYPQRMNREWMPASPGFDPYLENAYIAKYIRKDQNPDLDAIYREGRKYAAERDDGRFFEKQVLRAREGNPRIIFISGWNDWQYACQIEPAEEYGFKYVDLAAQLLGREAETRPYSQS
jgi:hypothetical protein